MASAILASAEILGFTSFGPYLPRRFPHDGLSQPIEMDGLAMLGKRPVVRTKIHVDYQLAVAQATVADVGCFTV